MKSLMLYSQGENDIVDLYVQSFKCYWDTSLAFGVSPGVHEGLMNNMLATSDWVADYDNTTMDERARVVRETIESVKASMITSRAGKK